MPTLAPAPATTDVLGYFNKNSFPLQITSEHLGVNMQVGPKAYVLDRAQRKINDPRLDFYASSGLLSKEFSKVNVPLVMLAGSPVAGAGPGTSVTSAVAAKAPAPRVPVQGTITLPGMPNRIPAAAVQAQPSVSAPGINAMSVADATRLGLIPRPDRRDHFSKLPNEDKTGEAARSAPSIDSITRAPVPVIPRGLNLRSADVSSIRDLEAENPAVALTAPEGSNPPPNDLAIVAAPPGGESPLLPGRPAVEYDGRRFTTAGNLKRAMLKKFNGDQSLADEAFETFKGKFAPQGKRAQP